MRGDPLSAAASFAASLLAPPRCGACGERCPWRDALCDRCEREVAGAASQVVSASWLEAAWCAAPYEGAVSELVAGLKFRRRLMLARRAAEAIVSAAPPGMIEGAIVPVPPAPWRLRVRGHDPAEEIAFALARIARLPFRPCLRRANGPRQVGRRRSARLADPPAVRVAGSPPRRAVLVDDVLTTGATLSACARALRRRGAERVVAVAFARA